MYPLIVEPEAEAELDDAYRWYEGQQAGMGLIFLAEVGKVFDRICRNPELHAIAFRGVRLTRVRRFRFVVAYLFENSQAFVLAVFHGHRDPGYWHDRIP